MILHGVECPNIINTNTLTENLEKSLWDEYLKLNQTGQEEAVKRIRELASLPQYQDSPQPLYPGKYAYVYVYPPEEDSKKDKRTPPQD